MTEIAKTADQALQVLEHVAANGPQPVAAIARELRMHRTVVHRLLATLHRRGYLRRATGAAGGYVPGLALLRVAHRVEPDLLAAARPVLARLAREHGETFILTVADGDEAVQIEQAVGSRHFVRVQLERGFRHPLVLGASGRAILAQLPADALAPILARAKEPRRLQAQLAETRRSGFAVSHDELSHSLYGVSAPVLAGGRVLASIGVVMPSGRAARVEEYARHLKKAAAQLGRELSQR